MAFDTVLQLLAPSGVAALLLVVLVLVLTVRSVRVVGDDERLVLLESGEVDRVLEPGIHVQPPFVAEARSVDVSTQKLDLTFPARGSEGRSYLVTGSVEYRIRAAERAHAGVGSHRSTVRSLVQEVVRDALCELDPEAVYDAEDHLRYRVRDEVVASLDEFGGELEVLEVESIELLGDDPDADGGDETAVRANEAAVEADDAAVGANDAAVERRAEDSGRELGDAERAVEDA